MHSDQPQVVVELIGDLDETLVASLSDMLANFARQRPTSVLLCVRHLALPTAGALAALGSAVSAARDWGTSIAIDPGNRKMRTAFGQAHIEHSAWAVARPAGARHFLMARHADPSRLVSA